MNLGDISFRQKAGIPQWYIVQKEDNNEYTLTDAMRILRSDEFKEYVFKIGIPISGKSVRITSKDIENYMF